MSVIISIQNKTDKSCPEIGWMFPCYICSSITSKNVIIEEIYRFYICNDCNTYTNLDILKDKLIKELEKKNKQKELKNIKLHSSSYLSFTVGEN